LKAELIEYDAISLGEMVRAGEIKPSELVEITIERIERVNPKLNAVIHKMYDEARKTAEKWDKEISSGKRIDAVFSGVPFFLKDLVAEYEGVPLSEGCAAVKGYISKLDTELVKRQKAAGLIIVGKTNTPELGCTPSTEPILFGPTLNPWDQSVIPGGSSGGSAAAVAAGIVPMAHGNDGGGSIRIPASCCGVFGMKPTRARNPNGPLFGDVAGGIAVEHALTRTVRDSAALLDATSGPDIGDPYYAPPKKRPFLEEVGQEVGRLNIGFLTSIPKGWSFDSKIHPECEKAVRDAAQLCESLGHNVNEINAEELSYPNLFMTFGIVFACLTGAMIAYWEKELGKKLTEDQMEAVTWMVYQNAAHRTGAEYLRAVEDCQLFSRKIAQWFHKGDYDLLLNPTLTMTPPKLGSLSQDKPGKTITLMGKLVAFTFIYNITGQPAMSVPLYWNADNIPIGIQFAGRFGDEATLFRLAAQLEQERPWIDRKPSIHCSKSF
jgi:amidase